MNRIHKLIWSRTQHRLVVVGEGVRGNRGKKRSRRRLAAPLAALTLLATPAWAQLPTGGNVVAGSGTIATSGADMTVHQSSQKMIANWQSFSIGKHNSVNFVQPNASAVALNRVTGHNTSQILGNLNANGQVFLVNPNGVVIGHGAQVRTGGFVASTLDVSDADFLAGNYRFEGIGGEILNQGDIEGKVVALIAPTVRNEGTITGDTALAAGTDVLLDFDGDGLLSVEVKASTLQTLVENEGLIRADGGIAILTARAASEAMKAVVNNSGRIEAQTLAGRNGRVLLLADMTHGEVNAAGELTANFVETSAAEVVIDSALKVDTQGGEWLIDPVDITIDTAKATAIQTALGSGNVTVTTSDTGNNGSWGGGTNGSGSDAGDIHVNADIAWSANTLTLNADRDININAVLTANGTSALAMNTGADGTVKVGFAPGEANGFAGRVDFDRAGTGFLTINGNGYTVINDLNALQAIGANSTTLSGRYALGDNIDASDTGTWNSGAGFDPIGNNANRFTGVFDGLGHTISDLTIDRSTTNYVGLFGYAQNATLRNVGMVGGSMTGRNYVGGLVGHNYASYSAASIINAYATGNVTGTGYVGGLVGYNNAPSGGAASITDAYATGNVEGNERVGGLVGYNYASGGAASITDAYATGSVTGTSVSIGGLVGYNYAFGGGTATILNAYATGSVTDTGTGFGFYVGGLVGQNFASGSTATILNAYATGGVEGNNYVGGLVGSNYANGTNGTASITNAYAMGNVTGNNDVGGLVGYNGAENNGAASIENAYATGNVEGNERVGGLVGYNGAENNGAASITNAYATGTVTGIGGLGNYVGGLVGFNYANGTNGTASIKNAYATGGVEGNNHVGGLVGYNYADRGTARITDTYATGSVTATVSQVGGLVGLNDGGTVLASFWDTDTSGITGGTGLTTAEMQNPFTFIDAGWDFSDGGAWAKSSIGENDGYMMLRWQPGSYYDGYLRVAGNVTRDYGDINPDLASVLTTAGTVGAVSWGSAVTATTNVGTYQWNDANVLSLPAGNIYQDLGTGSLSITPAALTVAANDASKAYDGIAYSGGNGVHYSGFVNGEDESVLSGALAYGGSAQGATSAGSYAIAVAGFSAANYVLSYVDGQLSITGAAVTSERDHDMPNSPAPTDMNVAQLSAAPALVQTESVPDNMSCLANGQIMSGAACGNE